MPDLPATNDILRLLGAFLIAGPVAAQGHYVLGPNIQVSRHQASTEYQETQIAADPVRAGHLLACAIASPHDSSENVFFVSFDNGKTWSPTLSVRPGVDPSCAIDRHGVAYAASVHDSAGSSFLNVQRSTDRGRTWRPSSIDLDTRSMDRSYVTVDDGPGLAGGRVYVDAYVSAPRDQAGKRLAAYAVVYTSPDDGRSFNHAVPVPAAEFSDPWFFPGNGVITPTGALAVLVVELDNRGRNMFLGSSDSASAPHAPNGVLRLLRSSDGGNTVATFRISDAFYDWRVPQLSMPALAVDRSGSSFRGRLYAVWPDARAERRTQIFLASSDDEGQTWTPPRIVSDEATSLRPGDRPNTFMPMVTVNNAGVVGLSWYDRRDSPNNLTYWPRFAASLDGGKTWLPSVSVSTSPNQLSPIDKHLNGGDTSGIAADADGVFHLLWIDNRTGVPQLWTTTVKVRGPVRRTTQ